MKDSTGRQNYYNKVLKKIYSTKSISFRIIFNFSFYIKLKFKSFKVNFVLLLYFPFPEIYLILYFYARIQKYIHFISISAYDIGFVHFLFDNLLYYKQSTLYSPTSTSTILFLLLILFLLYGI